MNWQEGVAVIVVLLGLGAGDFLVAQRPSFWLEFCAWLGNGSAIVSQIRHEEAIKVMPQGLAAAHEAGRIWQYG